MRTGEAAKILGCLPRSVRNMIERGALKAELKPTKLEYDISPEEVQRVKDAYEQSPPRKGRPRGKKFKSASKT